MKHPVGLPQYEGMASRAEATARASRARALREIATEIEGFLEEWVRRLHRLLGQWKEAAHGADGAKGDGARARSEALEEERRRWEVQRREEIERMKEDAQRLAEAWLRLEAEQRRLLQEQESLQLRASTNGNERPLEKAAPVPPSPEDVGSPAREMVVRQFEQMRREIDNHTRRTR